MAVVRLLSLLRPGWRRRAAGLRDVDIDQSSSLPVPNERYEQWDRHPRPRGLVERDSGMVRLGRDRRAVAVDVVDREPDLSSDPLGLLLRRAGRGDQSAFGELYDQLSPLVYGVVLKVVRDPSQSEEVAQEVFVELWRLAARYDAARGSVRSWAATVSHRRAIDRVRSEQSSRDRLDRDAANVTRDHDDVVAAVETNLDQIRVRRALGQLSPLQREAVELAYFGGHTYREVAVLLDVAEGTVKTRIRDGMIRLRDELGGES
jgi:RNA polymerase sigma-70 factor (ECF subfamily)